MICKNCKNEIEDDSKFCTFCGEVLVEDKTNEKLLFTIKPVFIVNLETILANLPAYMIISFFLMAFFGLYAIIIGPFLIHFVRRGLYEGSVYNFYPNRVESCSNFIYSQVKTLKYKDVVKTDLKKGIIQQKYNLGSITLASGRMDGFGLVSMGNIPNPDENYAKILQLIKENE